MPLGDLLGVRQQSSARFQGAPVKGNSQTTVSHGTQAPLKAGENGDVTINASVVYPGNVEGMWSYGTSGWNPAKLANGIVATGGGFAAGDYYYVNRYLEVMGFEEIKTINYKLSDWSEYDSYAGKIEYVATTMAYNPLRDEAYGCFINPERNGYNFVNWNYSYFQPRRVIRALERPWSGCAFSSDGTLYAIERNGDLYTVSLSDGAMTKVGSTGVTSNLVGDATIDTTTDTMYWAVADEATSNYALYAVNIATAEATKLYDLINEEQLCGMYIPVVKEIAAGAPAKISSVSTSFSGTNLNGKISFYTPRLDNESTPLDTETELTYTIRANGQVIATGSELPNKRVTADVTLPAPDNYNFTVTTTNAAGESEPQSTRKFVGPDTPKAPSQLQAAINGSTVSLQWSSVSSSGVNGGNVDSSSATYRVVRYPDLKVVADGVSARTATDELPDPETRTDYWYAVSATVSGVTTEETKSTVITLGPITPPFEGTFATSTSIAGWTILDANGDDVKWKYSSYAKGLEVYGSKGFDDWAITPAVKVRAATSYPFTVTLKTSNYYEETFEVKWGTAPTVEAMTNTVIASTSFKNTTAQTFEGEIADAPAGKIYIGIHATTAEKSNTLDLISFTIADGMTAGAPAAPTGFTVETPVDGTRQATITFKAPETTVNGTPLTGDLACTKIELFRDDNLIETFTDGIAPGSELSHLDNADDLTLGKHLYRAVASNAYGEGTAAEAEALVGARKPAAPESALMVEEGNTGRVTLSWAAVTTDAEGNTINADAVTYKVIDRQYNIVANNVTGTSVTIDAVPEGEQAFCQFGVYAVTAGGESDKMAATAYKPVGQPYAAPWSESFKDKSVSSIFGYNYIKGNQPWSFVSSHDWGILPQDEDNGFAYLECYGDLTALVTGKINLEGLDNPAFIYYTYNYTSANMQSPSNTLELQVDRGDGMGFVTVQSDRVFETGPENQWNKVVVPLAEYEGESVIFRIEPKNPQLALYTLDNLRVTSYAEYNLSASRITAPLIADVDKPFEVNVTVSNTGEQTINNYTVELYQDGELADFRDGARIEPNETKVFTFEQTVAVTAGEYASFQGIIVCDDDRNEADNTSETVTVGIVSPAVPAVNDLSASSETSGAVLHWSTPDLSNAPGDPFTETFDGAEGWSNTVAGWKFIDVDQIPVGGINMANFPCTGLQSWFVVNNTLAGIQEGTDPTRWNARSGQQFIASEYVMRANVSYQSDDWAITPLLNTCSQALSFYAKSFDPAYLETFEVLASSATTNTDDFVSVATVMDVPNAWTQYRFKLPEGTKYAAIRSRSTDKYFLFIDDVTFIPADATPAPLEITGYNIYRNGVKLNTEPVTDTSYTDETIVDGRDYKYVVTAVYSGKGESRPSNEVSLNKSGIAGAYDGSDVVITTAPGRVTVKGLAQGTVTVFTPAGKVMRTAEAAPIVNIDLIPGIYIVKAGAKVAKIALR